MAFGRDLDPEDSALIRAILEDPTVQSVTFYPEASGFAEYGELEYTGADNESTVLDADTAKFQAVFAIMLEHDYPAEFNDKFFVDLNDAPQEG